MQDQLLTQQEGVTVSIGLVMDGVTDLLDVNTTVTVYQNPEIDEFSSVQEYEQNNEITLEITVSMYAREQPPNKGQVVHSLRDTYVRSYL